MRKGWDDEIILHMKIYNFHPTKFIGKLGGK